MMSSRARIPVAILGATGVVGQRLVAMLENHPWFEARELVASDRSAGRAYGDAVDWRLPGSVPESVRDIVVRPLEVASIESALVFSALSAALAAWMLYDWYKTDTSYSEATLTSSREGEIEAVQEKHRV